MAEYIQACLVIHNVEDGDQNWLEQHYAALQRVIYDHDPGEEDRAAYNEIIARWDQDTLVPGHLGFTVEMDRSTATIAGEESADPQLMACLAQLYIQARLSEEHHLVVEYCYTADDPWSRRYGGGAYYIDHKNILNTDSRKWLEEQCS